MPDPERLDPRFAPRPGWGGRAKDWFRKTGRTLLERLVIIVAVPLLLAPVIEKTTDLMAPAISPMPEGPQAVTVTVLPGQGLTHAARIALYEYLALQNVPRSLAPEQYVFAEDFIARRMEPYVPEPGEALEIPFDLLGAAVLKAQSLTPAERAAWLRYVR